MEHTEVQLEDHVRRLKILFRLLLEKVAQNLKKYFLEKSITKNVAQYKKNTLGILLEKVYKRNKCFALLFLKVVV